MAQENAQLEKTVEDENDANIASQFINPPEVAQPIKPASRKTDPHQNLPIYGDINKLRPFEAMMVDNKDYPCEVRGSYKTAFVFVDVKTQIKCKIDLHSKKDNGIALKTIITLCGAHKLPYKCTVYSDGDGAMKYVKEAAEDMGICYRPLPPYDHASSEPCREGL